ncbi:MAG: ABC transporter substrate-binding protein [Streptomyces sp.]|nr:ABC transporter substrate-binding protein [Streptomyces sp.]
MPRPTMPRRAFLRSSAALTALGTASAVFGLDACGSGTGSSADRLVMLLPGDIPVGWDAIRGAVNAKLKADLGFTIDAQFVSWTNYSNQELLKFTSGERFDQALEARWLHLDQLLSSGSLRPMDAYFADKSHPHLDATVSAKARESVTYKGHQYAVPQVNYASAITGMVIRQDLAEKYGISSVETYEDFERYLYAVKQHDHGLIPFGLDNGYVNNTVSPQPTGLFNAHSWDDPSQFFQAAGSNAGIFAMDPKSGTTGSSRPRPFWEAPGVVETLHRIRRYNEDGILNTDVLNADVSSVRGLFGQGRYAATVGNTDGLTTTTFGSVTSAVHGAAIAQVVPFANGTAARPAATFQASNNVVINKNSAHADMVMKLQDWVSVKENHDLVSYGIEGKDWKAHDDGEFEALSKYVFPGFALCWRISLERTPVGMVDSERIWFGWAKDYNHFVTDPFTSFYFDQTPVKTNISQLASAYNQYGKPLFAGTVDVASGLSRLQSAFEHAGLDKVLGQLQTQADAYLASRKATH